MERENEARPALEALEYRALFEAAPDGIVLVDAEGVIVDANPHALKLFDYEREDLVGEKIEVLVPERVREVHMGERRAYMTQPRARPMGIGLELLGRRRDGSEFPVEISLSPMTTGDGRHIISIIRDVTERKRLQAFGAGALKAAEDERQRIARELHDDTAQRLAGLMLLLKVAGQIEDREERGQRLEQIREEIADAAEAVRRIARGLRPPALDEMGLVAAIDSLVRSLRRGISPDIELVVERAGERRLDPDAELALYRIVQEALANAVRHAGASRIRVSFKAGDESVSAEVDDDGRGLAADRGDGDGVHGMGLVGMRERARHAGGVLEIDSEPGRGTRVRVELPVGRRER